MLTRDDKLSGDTYERWSNDRYSIVRYSHWEGKEGTFFFAYDLGNLSRRINKKPVSSFEEARALIKE